MDKFSELKAAALAATPGPWGINRTGNTIVSNQSHPVATVSDAFHRQLAGGVVGKDAEFIAAANPAAVLALLAELEAKEEQRATWANRAEILGDKLDKAEKSITALDVRNAELHSRIERWATDRAESANQIEELEAKLAKPVRLPELCGDGENDNEYTEGLNDGINQSAKAIRAAGFTVEGDA